MEENETYDVLGPSNSSFGNDSVNCSLRFDERHSVIEQMLLICPMALYIDRFITPIWYFIGVNGNLFSLKVWTERRMRRNNSSAVYLITLCITDTLFLLLHIFQELQYAWGKGVLDYPVVCEGFFFLIMIFQYLSPLLVLGFTVERWIAICHPFKKETWCTTSRAVKVCVTQIIFVTALCSPQAYFWIYDYDRKVCTIRPWVVDGDDKSLWSIWTWVSEMMLFMLTPILIFVFNIQVIKEVRHLSGTHRSGDNTSSSRTTTVMLLSVSFYCFCTTLPTSIVYAVYPYFDVTASKYYLKDSYILLDQQWKRKGAYLTGRKIIEEMSISHYACNFFLYLCTGRLFQQSVKEVFVTPRLGHRLSYGYSCGQLTPTFNNTAVNKSHQDKELTCSFSKKCLK